MRIKSLWTFGPIGPSCRLYGAYRSETRVVSAVVGELVDMGVPGSEIKLEFVITPGNRCDIAVPNAEHPLVIECKAQRIGWGTLKQGVRYLHAAQERWPDLEPTVFLMAPDVDDTIIAPTGISVFRVAVR